VSDDYSEFEPRARGIVGEEHALLRGIVGGTVVGEQALPWAVALGTTTTTLTGTSNNQTDTFFCGGTLISHRFVITAAHCIESLAAQPILLLGTIDIKGTKGVRRGIKRVSIHPGWNATSKFPQNDLALIEMDSGIIPSFNIEPICLPLKNIRASVSVGRVWGWGRLLEGGPTSQLLRSAEVTLLGNDDCRQVYGDLFRPGAGLLCARGHEFVQDSGLPALQRSGLVTDSCQGDSGGGLIVEDEGRVHLVGVVSGGIGCGLASYPGIYVDVVAHISWILDIIN